MLGKKEDEFIEQEHPLQMLNRDMLKYIAALLMLLYHMAVIFLPTNLISREILVDLGMFAPITAAYCLVEGYYHTSSMLNYGKRLLIFGLIAEVPYCMAFSTGTTIQFVGLDIILSLYLCLLILYVKDHVKSIVLKIIFLLLLFLGCLFCEWTLFLPVFTILFHWASKVPEEVVVNSKDPARIKEAKERTVRIKMKGAFYLSAVLYGIYSFVFNLGYASLSRVIIYSVGSMAGLLLAAIVVLYFYNGNPTTKEPKKTFNKWFFYGFYPAMLFVCGIVRMIVG